MCGDDQSQRRGARGGGILDAGPTCPPPPKKKEGRHRSRQSTEILRKHGLVIIKGLLPPSQTVPWGDAALAYFNAALSRLRRHPTRPVDLMNPHTAAAVADADDAATSDEHRAAFEPLSYREMAMREDLRVDLLYGPAMESLRHSQNNCYLALRSGCSGKKRFGLVRDDVYCGPGIVDANIARTVACWRFHPSILAIIKSVFDPREGSLFRGNFGRWNFGGAGPDGSPRPFRLGQVGSVLSCSGLGDQAIHADTPHLLSHQLPPVSLFERFHPRLSRRRRSCQRMPPKRIRGRIVDQKFC